MIDEVASCGAANVSDQTTSADESKPSPDIFGVALKKLQSRAGTPSRSATRRTTLKLREGRASRQSAYSAEDY
jgi:hypothetical protein